MISNHNYNVPFRCFTNGAHGSRPITSSHERTTLLAFVLAATLAMTLVVTVGGGEVVLYAGEFEQIIVPNLLSYHQAGDIWPILDLTTSVSLLEYAFAQVTDSTPPTFDSSVLNNMTGVLTIVFSEPIDVALTNSTKIHIRESGNYTGGITLSAGELGTTSDDATISFNLNVSRLAAVAVLTTPELTIEPGAVQDTFGNLIDGTFDVSTATFVTPPFDVSSQDTAPYGIAFSNDGTKMFVVGDDHNYINQYTLSIAFDISTAFYDGNDERFTKLQDTSPRGMAFSNNGTKMFVVGDKDNVINQYALSTPFDVSTANFTTAISTPDNYPKGMAFSNDGTKMFVVSSFENAINQYTLSIAFDISTAFYDGNDERFTKLQDTYPKDMAFSNDGTKMFVVGTREDAINQYTLSTAFDLSTANFTTAISTQDTNPAGMTFSNDGAKMFVVGDHGEDVNEYALSSVYPITVTDTVNQAPSAEAGPNLSVDEGGSIALQGSGSDDDAGDELTYSWSEHDLLTFDNRTSATPEVTASSVTANTTITLTLSVSDGIDSDMDTMVLTITNLNHLPVAEAGPNLSVDEGGSIALQGSGSDDDAGDELTYSWSEHDLLTFDNRTSATPEVTASSVTANTTITLTLSVSDGIDSDMDTMVLTITNLNHLPVAEAGPNLSVDEGGSIALQGSGSDDDAGDELTYSWSEHDLLTFDNRTSATPEVTASSVTANTTITLTLSVSDGIDSDMDTMVLTITNLNHLPVAEAGPNLSVDEGGSIALQGSGSDDDAGDELTYSWSEHDLLTFDNRTSATPEVTASLVTANTTITLTLSVSDGIDSDMDTMVLTITNLNHLPVAEAGPNLSVDEGGSIALQGSGSDDDAGDELTYSWSEHDLLTFDNRTSATPEVTASLVTANTTITLTLSVSDGIDSDMDTMVLTITNLNHLPVAEAGPNLSVDEGGSIALQGSGSDDDAGDELTYSWSEHDLLTFDNRTSATPEVTASSVTANTTITLTLSVSDGIDSDMDTMVLTITNLNHLPVAEAGPNLSVDGGDSIALQGSGSDDDAGDELTYSWSEHDLLTFDNRTSATPEVTASLVTANTTITLTLSVSDGIDSDMDTMVLTITNLNGTRIVNAEPVAEAGPNLSVDEGGSIALQGSGSDDDAGDELTYSWSEHDLLTFDNRTSATPEVTASLVTANTTITLTLSVSDGIDSDMDTMVLTITNLNHLPVAEAGPNLSVDGGGSIALQGSGSDDDAGDELTYSWSEHDLLTFDNRTSATPEVTASLVTANTTITLTLSVSDGIDSDMDTMVLTITNLNGTRIVNAEPVAEAGPNLSVDEGGSIALQGSGSDDDAGDELTYSWSEHDLLTFDNRTSATPEVTASLVTANTTITLTLSVSDGIDSDMDTMVLTITNLNHLPVAEAGPNLSVDEGGSIALQGSGSDDDAGDELTYLWSEHDLLTFENRTFAAPTVTASSVTNNTRITLTLTVSDGTTSDEDTMVLTIRNVTSENLSPSVSVGPDQTVREGAQVSMPWTATDPDGDPLTYSWSQNPLLPAISLDSPDLSPTTFTAPAVDANTTFIFTLTVTAGTHTVEDSLTVTVRNNHPPSVDAGPDKKVDEGTTVTLTGSANDPDKDPLTYVWERISGSPVTLTDGDTLRPQFAAPRVTSDEQIVFRLNATDDAGKSAEDTVTITVRDVPISVSSVTYNPGNGHLTITFNQNIGPSDPDYSAMHIRSTGSDSGGIALSDVSGASHSGRTVTATLDSGQQEEYGDLESAQLDIAGGAVTDADGVPIIQMPDIPISDVSRKKSSSSKAPIVHINALVQARIVDIPPHIAEQVASHDASSPLEPVMPDDTFDFPLVINGYGYLLDDTTNTLVPQTVKAGDDSATHITFTVYTQQDLAHFTLYLNLSDENTNYADSDTYITYKDDGTTSVTDPHGYIDSVTVTVTQEDDQVPEKKTVRIIVEFEEPMGPTNMVAYMWNTDRKATFVRIIDAFEVVAAAVPQEPEMQEADPEPAVPDSGLPADPEPAVPDSGLPADPEPVPRDTPWPDDYDDAQVLTLIRMWSGFEAESITDAQLIDALGLTNHLGSDLPDWMMTELGVLVAKGDVTVDEFVLALQYVLTHA